MLKNYFKIALRNISKNKLFSFINIVGLAIGMACFILIMLWVKDELNYERYNKNADRICRVIWDMDGTQIFATPGPFANWLKETVPGIQEVTRVNHDGKKLQYKDKRLDAAARYIEPRFFDIFPFQFIKGDPKAALNDVGSIVITESIAQTLFGGEEAMGKTITQADDPRPLIVTGVVKDIPRLTHEYIRKTDCFLSFALLRTSRDPDSWYAPNADYKTYVLLNKGASYSTVSERMNAEFKIFLDKYNPALSSHIKFFLQPITRTHLYSDFKFENKEGNIQYVIFFTLIAAFILFMACINFMNLATARSIKRTKEVGLRKVIGASRSQLIKQFLGESILISAIAFVVALAIVELFLPAFSNFTGKPLSLDFSNIEIFIGLICLLIFTGIISGSYPAIFLSSFTPVKILKGPDNVHSRSSLLRRLLVISQFAISIVLIIGTIIIYQQLHYMKNKDLGFDKENLIYLETEDFSGKYEAIKNELLQHPEIISVAASGDMLLNIGTNNVPDWEGMDKNAKWISFPSLYVTEDFAQTFKLRMAEGRFFSKEYPSDEAEGFVINEAAVKAMHMQNPVGKRLHAGGKEGKIIGVVKNFNFRSLRSEVEPLMLSLYGFRHLYLRVKSNDIGETIGMVEQIYHKQYPEHQFTVHFFDEEIDKLYQSEGRMENIFGYFSILAIFIACLGLFGLVSFVSENKTKEMGIRKVLGASVANVVSTLTKDFVIWALLANTIAWPIAYFAMNKWLQGFAYRIDESLWAFILAGGLTLLIVLITVGYQAIKAATANPVESLRYE
ncbi:MAG TPA: ABC transporter permease [Candidatus Acidoferrales bacterium]|nr:ABC transporter permease [Candidatus Acidoferrales bacterium]